MITTPSPDNLMLGAGMLYFDRFVNGKATGNLRPLGNVPKFGMKPEVEKKEKMSSMQAAKRLYKSIIISIKYTGNVTLDEYDPMNLALALLGESAIFTQAAKTAQTKTFTKTQLGMAYHLEDKKVKNVVVTCGAAGATTTPCALGVDYRLNEKTGLITPLRTSTVIVDGDDIKVVYDCDAFTAPMIIGGTDLKSEGLLYFVGDPTTGPAYELTAWKCLIVPEGEIDWISEDWGSIGISIEMQDDSENHPAAPFFQQIKIN